MLSMLKVDPIPALLASRSEALVCLARRDLLAEDAGPVTQLWELPEALKILRKQEDDGSWPYTGKVSPWFNYDLLETFRNLGFLVEMYGFNREHPAIGAAAEYAFSCQAPEGDLRGILGEQYMPYYHGAIIELLIKAGYGDDPRTIAGLDWLMTMRQNDGGWIVPLQALPPAEKIGLYRHGPALPPNRALPFSHLATGMILRPLALHPAYRGLDEVGAAATLFKQRFLKADKYNDRRAPDYWTKFQFPYWWPDLLNGLDILSRTGFTGSDADVQRALQWFISHQQEDGLWPTGYEKGSHARTNRKWVGLAACRVLRRFLAPPEPVTG
ncbi:MAG: hypothetical protein M1455_00295 [Actinobacteria bacterium]|nr:hypothetical protein [Actinomycetota bacterium]